MRIHYLWGLSPLHDSDDIDFEQSLCYSVIMAEEKQTLLIDDSLCQDDIDALRLVLEDEHSRGMTPVSIYRQSEVDLDLDLV